MKNSQFSNIETSYRTLYGKLFSALLKQLGPNHVNEIEDAIQNSFYKSLKSWKYNQVPKNKENWLFIVARNDAINQIKRQNRLQNESMLSADIQADNMDEDLRLKTILYLAKSRKVSSNATVIFVLKNIFGLHVKEIAESTLISQEAIYKSINRAKRDFQATANEIQFDSVFEQVSEDDISLIEEILYAVFNVGFDSFSEKIENLVNEDLCIEALSLGKMMVQKYGRVSTKNLLSLFCFHLARLPEKIKNGKIISFFDQDRAKWNRDFIDLGFHYLEKPDSLNKYYIESLIISKHMTTTEWDTQHWEEIVKLYQIMHTLSTSPIMKLNFCYCLQKAGKVEEALELLTELEKEIPENHLYFSLVKANLLDTNTEESGKIIADSLKMIKQKIRKEYILETMSSDF